MSKKPKKVSANSQKTTSKTQKIKLHHKIKKSFNDRHPFVVPLTTISGLMLLSIFGWIFFGGQIIKPTDARIIKFYSEGKNQTIPTRASTVKEFLDRSGIELEQGDIVEPSVNSQITTEEFSINLYKAKLVTIIDNDGKKVITKTAETVPEVIVKKAGYNLYPEDAVEVVSPNDAVENGILGTQIFLDKAIPVKLVLYGKNYDIRTRADTVAELAKERNIPYDSKSILPAPNEQLSANQAIFVTQPGKKLVSGEELIPRGEETVQDENLELGKTEVKEEGNDGKKAIVYEVLSNGEKKYLHEVVILKPVNKVISKGTKTPALSPNVSVSADKASLMAAAGISPSDYSVVDFIVSKESGWRPGAGNPSSGAYGLCQALPASKMSSAGSDYMTNPVTQLKWCAGYATGRYGSWQAAYNFWVYNRWW